MSPDCIDADVMAAYLEGTLDAATRASVEVHVDGCRRCHAELAALLRLVAPTASTQSGGPMAALAPVIIGHTIGRYVVRAWLGAGGMGVVYRAWDPTLERDVALKIVRRPASDAGASLARLSNEAVQMAKVTHPNVVQVFDAGTEDGRTYVAQELVEGVTLEQWQRASGRTFEALLGKYIEAGRGLAAAHAAGILHRDFKPSNVLVGEDGRARVGDFGLALSLEDGAARGPGDGAGTPRYMAPEQRNGKVTTKTDQYAFALALREAIAGRPPPRRVARAIERALSEEPDRRFATMDELLLALTPPSHARRAWIVAASVAAASVAALLLLRRPSPCVEIASELAPLRSAIAGSASWAPAHMDASTADVLRRWLESWSSAWTDARTRACRDTRVSGVQSEAALDLRMRCLADQRHEVEAIVGAIGQGRTEGTVLRRQLPRPTDCDDLRVLEQRLRPPMDPSTARVVEDARLRLAEGRAQFFLGRWKETVPHADFALRQALRVGYRPLEAEAQLTLGSVAGLTGSIPEALTRLRAAHRAAVASHYDAVAARALVFLVLHLGVNLGRVDEAREVALDAEAAIEASGGDEPLAARVETSLGQAMYFSGKYADAIPHFDRALGLLKRARERGRPEDAAEAEAMRARGVSMLETGRVAEGVAAVEAGVRIAEALASAVPTWKSMLSASLDDLARARAVEGRLEEALAARRRSVALASEVRGPKHRDVALATLGVARDLEALGRLPEAIRAYDDACAIVDDLYAPDHPTVIAAHVGAENARLRQGHLDASALKTTRAALERARAGLAKSTISDLERGRLEIAFVRLGIAERGAAACALAASDFARGVELLERAQKGQFLLPHERADAARALWASAGCAGAR